MREQWDIFICDYCGAKYRSRKEQTSLNNAWRKIYKVDGVIDNKAHYQEFCSVNCCHKYVSEALLSELCSSITVDRRELSYYDDTKDGELNGDDSK